MLKVFRYYDWPLLITSLILSLAGLIMIYSTGLAGPAEASLWIKQALALLIGFAGLLFFSTLNYRYFKKISMPLYLLALLLLVAVLFFGVRIRGGTRWFDMGPFNFQPVEFSKLALLIILAKYFSSKEALVKKFRYVAASLVFVLIPVILIILQPDLGSAAIHLAIWFGILLVTAMPRRYFLYLFVVFLVFSVAAWQFFFQDYQKDRIRSFLNPNQDPKGTSYNVLQSIVAVGSGGLLGRGLARGLQSQLKFLPERQTDFIFASTVEELGLLGGALILALLAFLLFRMLLIAGSSRDLFGTYLGSGIFFLIFTQVLVNIGMNLGLLPVTGITLPFLSYGGSSLVMIFWLVGIVENIARHSVPVRFG